MLFIEIFKVGYEFRASLKIAVFDAWLFFLSLESTESEEHPGNNRCST